MLLHWVRLKCLTCSSKRGQVIPLAGQLDEQQESWVCSVQNMWEQNCCYSLREACCHLGGDWDPQGREWTGNLILRCSKLTGPGEPSQTISHNPFSLQRRKQVKTYNVICPNLQWQSAAELVLDLGLILVDLGLLNVPQERKVTRGRGPCGLQHQGRLSNHDDGLYMSAMSLNPFTAATCSCPLLN